MNEEVKFLMSKGYPFKIIGNDGYKATLCGMQRLNDGDYMAIYRYPGGPCCHNLEEINKYYTAVESEE